MSDLKLDSLRIQNFRTFKDLTIDRLGRVNLIVGKNNVGKTALLRAIWIWAHPEYWRDLIDFLYEKYQGTSSEPERLAMNKRLKVVSGDFHGFPNFSEGEEVSIKIGPACDEGGSSTLVRFEYPRKRIRVENGFPKNNESESLIRVDNPTQSSIKYRLKDITEFNYVPSSGINIEDAGRLWDEVIRSNRKKRVIDTISLTVPEEVEDVNWIKEPSLHTITSGGALRRAAASNEDRVPMVTLEGREEAVPLSSFGEGTERTLWIGCAIVNSRDGILMIDEIENGLHYRVQPKLWKIIFETARELGVQVFATTHSQDCVQAFQQVADDYRDEEGMLIQLRRKRSDPEDIVAVTIDEEELQDALRFQVDPR